MDRRVTPPKRVTSPTWGPPPPCKQALNINYDYVIKIKSQMLDKMIKELLNKKIPLGTVLPCTL